jgi:hypothetical protein
MIVDFMIISSEKRGRSPSGLPHPTNSTINLMFRTINVFHPDSNPSSGQRFLFSEQISIVA